MYVMDVGKVEFPPMDSENFTIDAPRALQWHQSASIEVKKLEAACDRKGTVSTLTDCKGDLIDVHRQEVRRHSVHVSRLSSCCAITRAGPPTSERTRRAERAQAGLACGGPDKMRWPAAPTSCRERRTKQLSHNK